VHAHDSDSADFAGLGGGSADAGGGVEEMEERNVHRVKNQRTVTLGRLWVGCN